MVRRQIYINHIITDKMLTFTGCVPLCLFFRKASSGTISKKYRVGIFSGTETKNLVSLYHSWVCPNCKITPNLGLFSILKIGDGYGH